MTHLWRRTGELLWPSRSRQLGRANDDIEPPSKNPSPTARRSTFTAGALRTAEIFVGHAEEFWTGKEARHSKNAYPGPRGSELISAKTMRIVQGNGHMLTAIWTLLSATVPSEITCPNCLATIRAPYAEEVQQ